MTLTEASQSIRASIVDVRAAVKRLAVASAVLTEAGDENRVDLLQVISSHDASLASVDHPLRHKLREMREGAHELRDEINNIKSYIK